MLARLRRNMALLNAAISGAILLAMALVALGVSDGMLVRQYEQDLAGSSTGLFTAIDSNPGNVGVAYATKQSFSIYYEGGGQSVLAGGAVEYDKESLTGAVQAVRAQVEREAKSMDLTVSASPSQGDILYRRVLITDTGTNQIIMAKAAEPFPGALTDSTTSQSTFTEPIAPSITITKRDGVSNAVAAEAGPVLDTASVGIGGTPDAAGMTKSFSFVYGLNNLLVESGGKSYRVAATVVSGGKDGMMLVLQDRAEELAARSRLRWLFFGCAMGGLILVGAASLFLSRRAVRPVEASIERQRAFVAAASHELRTPVAALRANAEVLKDAELGEFAPFLESIEQESLRMGLLVSDLTDLARADAGKLSFLDELVDVSEAARQTVNAMRPLAERKSIELTEELQPAWIRGDAGRLRQALTALLDNAIRYTQAGGHVRVRLIQEKQRVLLTVTDDGPGIPDAHKAKVFDRFYRVDPARAQDGGSGLGLSVARQIVEHMKGSITLRDGENSRGCAFEMRWNLGARSGGKVKHESTGAQEDSP